jgi:hypothetical protein
MLASNSFVQLCQLKFALSFSERDSYSSACLRMKSFLPGSVFPLTWCVPMIQARWKKSCFNLNTSFAFNQNQKNGRELFVVFLHERDTQPCLLQSSKAHYCGDPLTWYEQSVLRLLSIVKPANRVPWETPNPDRHVGNGVVPGPGVRCLREVRTPNNKCSNNI